MEFALSRLGCCGNGERRRVEDGTRSEHGKIDGTRRGGLVVVQDSARVTLYSARQVERALATGKSGKIRRKK